MIKMMKSASVAVALLGLGACATYTQDSGLGGVNDDLRARTGEVIARAELAEPALPFEGEITATDVVKSALQYNAELQASLEELNMASAAEVQAGLLINPTFEGEFVFGDETALDFDLAFNITQLLTRGRRIKVAKAELEEAKLKTTEAIVRTVAEAKRAALMLWQAERAFELMQEMYTVRKAGAEIGAELKRVKNITDGQYAKLKRQAVEASLAAASAELMVYDARERLSTIAGRPLSPVASVGTSGLPPASEGMEMGTFLGAVIEKNLILEAKRAQLRAQAARLGLAKVDVWFEHLEAAAVLEREEGDVKEGFAIGLPVPIFDWGQVRTGKAKAALKAMEYQYKAMLLELSNKADAQHRYTRMLKMADVEFGSGMRQEAEEEFAFREQQMAAMQIGPLMLLDAKIQQLTTEYNALNLKGKYLDAEIISGALLSGVSLEMGAVNMPSMAAAEEGGH